MKRSRFIVVALLVAVLTNCSEKQQETRFYDKTTLGIRDIIVSVEAGGIIEPILTVDVKSKASGEILSFKAETGDQVTEGTTLVQIDERAPTNTLAQSKASLEAAIARRTIAESQAKRAESMFAKKNIPEQDYEQAILELANARAEVVRFEVAVENARIALDDTIVRAPITGTIIEKLVEKGQVISSPTMDVGGGSLLMQMADLSSVQVRIQVDETDVGKVLAEQPVTITVTAYPNQPFQGFVKKIEPKAEAQSTVTTFSVLVVLDNKRGLLRPGMNADVEIRIEEQYDVLAIPTMALRTMGDIAVSAQLTGLSEDSIRSQLGVAATEDPATARKRSARKGDATKQRRRGRPETRSMKRKGYDFSSSYWVIRVNSDGNHEAINVKTGLTNLDYNAVVEGLAEGDEVLMLPSSGLVMDQQYLQQRIRSYTSMPGMGGNSSN